MARKPDIQYIRYVTDGSSARVLQPARPKAKTRLPKIRLPESPVIKIDPLAVAGMIVSVIMVVLMLVNCAQLSAIQQQANVMDDYVDQLKTENARLTDLYKEGYNLEDVREKALALGAVPIDQVQRITVEVPVTEIVEDTAEDGGLVTFLTGLFE